MKAATNNSTLYFPTGTYNVKWVADITNFKDFRCKATDRQIRHQTDGTVLETGRGTDMGESTCELRDGLEVAPHRELPKHVIRETGFDANGTPTFGGIGIKRPKRLHIANTHAFDSREQPPLFGKDRFAWAIFWASSRVPRKSGSWTTWSRGCRPRWTVRTGC